MFDHRIQFNKIIVTMIIIIMQNIFNIQIQITINLKNVWAIY